MRLTPKGSKRGQPSLLTFATLDKSPLRYALVYPGPHPCRPPPLVYIISSLLLLLTAATVIAITVTIIMEEDEEEETAEDQGSGIMP